MKKIISLALALVLCLGMFAACGSNPEPAPAPAPEATPAPEVIPEQDPAADPGVPAAPFEPTETDAPTMPEVTPDAEPEPMPTPEPTPAPAPAPESTPAPAPAPAPEGGLTAADVWNAIAAAIDLNDMPAFMDGDAELLSGFYGLSEDSYADFVCKFPMMIVHATEICIIRAKDVNAVNAGFAKRLADLDATWSTYLPDQYALVENAQIVTNGEWMLLVVAENADAIVAAFNSVTK